MGPTTELKQSSGEENSQHTLNKMKFHHVNQKSLPPCCEMMTLTQRETSAVHFSYQASVSISMKSPFILLNSREQRLSPLISPHNIHALAHEPECCSLLPSYYNIIHSTSSVIALRLDVNIVTHIYTYSNIFTAKTNITFAFLTSCFTGIYQLLETFVQGQSSPFEQHFRRFHNFKNTLHWFVFSKK